MPDTPLWSDDDQTSRLAELTADTSDPAKELPLRRDVRSLGMLLGRVLVEQEGEAFFEVVERLRRLLIQHREPPAARNAPSDDPLMAQAHEVIRGEGEVLFEAGEWPISWDGGVKNYPYYTWAVSVELALVGTVDYKATFPIAVEAALPSTVQA